MRSPEDAPPRGKGLFITGISITAGVGVPAVFGGMYCIVNDGESFDPCSRSEGTAAITFGLLTLGVSIPMIIGGHRRKQRYKAWKNGRLSLATGRTSLGTRTAGVRVRF